MALKAARKGCERFPADVSLWRRRVELEQLLAAGEGGSSAGGAAAPQLTRTLREALAATPADQVRSHLAAGRSSPDIPGLLVGVALGWHDQSQKESCRAFARRGCRMSGRSLAGRSLGFQKTALLATQRCE
jgi:hypothetical protein